MEIKRKALDFFSLFCLLFSVFVCFSMAEFFIIVNYLAKGIYGKDVYENVSSIWERLHVTC